MVREKWWQPRWATVAGTRPSLLLESIPPHIQNWAFIFSDLRMPLFPRCPPTRPQCLCVGKRHRGEPVQRRFQRTVSALSCVNSSLSTCDGLAHHLRLDSEHLHHRGLVTPKGNLESADSPAGQLLANHATAEFSVLTRGNAQEHGVPCFLFRSTVCQLGWLPGHAYIFFSNSKLQVAHARGGKAVAKCGPTVLPHSKANNIDLVSELFLKEI